MLLETRVMAPQWDTYIGGAVVLETGFVFASAISPLQGSRVRSP
jgi:hypothetical protein